MIAALADWRGAPWHTVVYVGAGASPPAIAAASLVLVEGHRATCARLRAATRRLAHVEVLRRVVGHRAERAVWHRHSWPAADGLADLSEALRPVYPRVRRVGGHEVEVHPLSGVIEGLALSNAPNLLVLDLPADADALAAGLPAPLAMRFEAVATGGLPGHVSMPEHLVPLPQGDGGAGPWRWRGWQVDAPGWRKSRQLADAESRLASLARAEAKLALVAELLLVEPLQ